VVVVDGLWTIDGFPLGSLAMIFSFLLWFLSATLTKLYFSEFYNPGIFLPTPTLAAPIELVELTLPALLIILSLYIFELCLFFTLLDTVPDINLELKAPLLELTEIEVF
jgi:hypothetical protein